MLLDVPVRPNWSTLAAALAAFLAAHGPLLAETLMGTVRNGTTGKPASGDEVLVFSVTGGRGTEIGRGRTDAAGKYRIGLAGGDDSRLVRVLHQGLGYQATASAGTRSLDVEVFDVASRLEEVTATADIRLEAEGGSMKVIEEFSVRNSSTPPRTLRNDRPFEVQIPPEAEVLAGAMQAPGRQASKFKPVPGGQKGLYEFPLVLLPGESRFAIAYALVYNGQAEIQPRIPYPLTHVAATLPASMKLDPKSPGLFELNEDQSWAIVRATASPRPGQSVAFRVSGAGSLSKVRGTEMEAQPAQAASQDPGLVAPSHGTPAVRVTESSPAPWDRRVVMGGMAILLAAGAVGVSLFRRKQAPVALG